ILVRKTEMKAHDLWMKLHHEIAHFFVKGRAGGLWNGTTAIHLQLVVVCIQALFPFPFPSIVLSRRLMAEEVCIDGTRCFSPDGIKLLACLFHIQQRASKRTQASSL